jgi:hypothetical protein
LLVFPLALGAAFGFAGFIFEQDLLFLLEIFESEMGFFKSPLEYFEMLLELFLMLMGVL